MKMFLKLCLVSSFGCLLSGCGSVRFLTTIEKQKGGIVYSVKFRIEQLNYPELPQQLPDRAHEQPGTIEGYCFRADGSYSGISTNQLLKVINAKAVERYPSRFSVGAEAMPIRIRLTRDGKSTGVRALFSQILVLGLLPTFFTEQGDFELSVHADGSKNGYIGRSTFQRVNKGWISLITPWAAFNVPGETHAKKTTWWAAIPVSGNLTIESIVDAIEQILQQRDLTPEINEYIKSQRRF